MQLAIVQNPHAKDPEALWKSFDAESAMPRDDVFDKAGLMELKHRLSSSPSIKVK